MKRIITYSLLIIIFTSLGIIGMNYEVKELPNSEILNKEFYKFDKTNSNYEVIEMLPDKINYTGDALNNSCKNYTYNGVDKTLKLDCGQVIEIVLENSDVMVLKINDETNYYFSNKEKSYEYEFKKIYGLTLEELKEKVSTLIEDKKIDEAKLDELIKSDTTSYVYIKNPNYNNTYALIENKLPELENSYYINVYDLTKEELTTASVTESGNPIILTVGNGYVKKTTIKLKGITVDNLENYLKGSENIEEENN